jgi:hypothetical protein
MIRVLYSLLAGRRGIWVASRQWLLGMETGDGMSKVGLEGGVKGLKGIRVYRGLRTIDQSKQSSTGGHSWGHHKPAYMYSSVQLALMEQGM